MPMDFPDLKSLKFAAKAHKFRDINENETEIEYRNALADFISSKDFIESEEIRNSVGWDKWDEEQKSSMLIRHLLKRNK